MSQENAKKAMLSELSLEDLAKIDAGFSLFAEIGKILDLLLEG